MLRFILKTIWNNRRNNILVLLELIVIAIVSWAVIDPIFVLKYNQSIPDGFDAEGLYELELETVPDTTSTTLVEDFYRLMKKLRNHNEIESATYIPSGVYPCSTSDNRNNLSYKDSTQIRVSFMYFFPNNDTFKTWRFRSAKDGTWETLENLQLNANSNILTSDIASVLSPDQDLTGKYIYTEDSTALHIAGLMQPVKMKNSIQPYFLRLVPIYKQIPEASIPYFIHIFFRTKPGISEDAFMNRFPDWANDNLISGNLFAKNVIPFHKIRSNSDLNTGAESEIKIKYGLAYFFMINLLLAISGTFWWRTRSRKEEIGIHMAYGASSSQIRLLLIGEAFLLVTIAVIIGCSIYLQWILYDGLYTFNNGAPTDGFKYVSNQFLPHFLIVSGIVYVIMLVVTWLGVYIPAYNASRIPIVNALKDE